MVTAMAAWTIQRSGAFGGSRRSAWIKSNNAQPIAAINANDESRADRHEQAAALARSYLMTVSFDPLFKTLDGNRISPLSLREVLGGALKQVVAALPT